MIHCSLDRIEKHGIYIFISVLCNLIFDISHCSATENNVGTDRENNDQNVISINYTVTFLT